MVLLHKSAPVLEGQQFADCEWIVFDAVGTLITPNPSVSKAYHDIGRRFGSKYELSEVGKRFHAAFRRSELNLFPGAPANRYATNDAVEAARWRWIVGEVLPDATDPDACFQELWNHFAYPSSWDCYDDAADAISRLSTAGYRMAIASNFDGRLHPVCDGLPHLTPIGHRIVSASVQFRKPAPEFYRQITHVCGCQPHQILMVGDDYEHDVLAPRTAGFQALHLDRKQRGDGTGLVSLTELADMLTAPPRT